MSIWSIEKPYFDTLLLKFWPSDRIDEFIAFLNAETSRIDIVDWLTPNIEKSALLADNSLINTIRSFFEQRNLCDRYMVCQNVTLHSTGLRCITAAGIRKRLIGHLTDIPLFNDIRFQTEVVAHRMLNNRRRNIGVLVLNCGTDASACRQRAMEVLFENFYLYTTPVVDVTNANNEKQDSSRTVGFITKQICHNADCMVIFVDEAFVNSWQSSRKTVYDVLERSIRCDFRIRLVIISLCEAADMVTDALGRRYSNLKPALLMFDRYIMAPSGGLISFIEQSCKLSISNTFLKYWIRSLQVLDWFNIGSATRIKN